MADASLRGGQAGQGRDRGSAQQDRGERVHVPLYLAVSLDCVLFVIRVRVTLYVSNA